MDSLSKLYVEITTTCNLDCQMCMRRAWDEPIGLMSLDVFAGLMAQIGHLPAPPTVHLSGYGEPMHHPDFLEMVRLAKATGARVEATTNGTLLTRERAQTLVDLQLDRLVVSIDGVSPGIYHEIRTLASLDRVVDNLRWLHRFRLRKWGRHGKPRLALAFVAMRRNVDDLPKLPALASYVGAWEILVSNVVPHTAEMQEEILYEDALRACAFRASRWVPDMSLPKMDLAGPVMQPLERVFASRVSVSLLDASLSARNDYCRFAQEGYAAIRWDGEVSPCLSLLHNHPEYIRGRRKDVTHLSLGNIKEQSLPAIWESDAFSEFRSRLREFHFSPCSTCGGCERFPRNLEDCTGNTFPTCGGCLWSQGFVQCA